MSPVHVVLVTAPSVTDKGRSHVMKAPKNYDGSRPDAARAISLFSDRLGSRLQRCQADLELLSLDFQEIDRRLLLLEQASTTNERACNVR